MILAYDSIAYEFDNKSLKYIAYRIPRYEIIIGKYLSFLASVLILNMVLIFSAVVYVYFARDISYFKEGIISLVLLMLFLSVFLGLIMFISIISKNAQKAFRLCLLALILLFGLSFFELSFMKYVSPLSFAGSGLNLIKNGQPELIIWLYILYGASFVFLGTYIFSKRDIY